ncbi:MAG: hypothetical protein ACPG4S_08015, partial [Schleiferiaceae bacterium]
MNTNKAGLETPEVSNEVPEWASEQISELKAKVSELEAEADEQRDALQRVRVEHAREKATLEGALMNAQEKLV